MTTVELGKPADNALPFHVERAKAIQAYASVELALSHLLAILLGTSFDLAGLVFFRITSANSRNAIIESLLEKRYGTTYQAYWHGIPNTPHKRGLFTWIKQLDQRRNEIVHWHTVNNIHIEGDTHTSTLTLSRPNAWAFRSEIQSITVEDMCEFCAKAAFASRSITMFMLLLNGDLEKIPDAKQTWHDICQQPCIYPPPDTHPLSQNYEAHQIPPESSQA
ncbi:MAG: hypothetical protein HC850_00855 [Rhodomicrobium sp.]|nr:hypothetical protein [Rhodomicrobium sp.]